MPSNQLKTIITVDRCTTLELEGRRGAGRIDGVLKHVRKIDGATTETTEVPFVFSDETLRNVVHALEGYR